MYKSRRISENSTPPLGRDSEDIIDKDLMVLASNGDQSAFGLIICRYQQALVNFFRKMGVNNDEEDLAQETFVKLFKFRDRYRPRAKFKTFLYFVARRIYVDYVRKRAREKTGVEGFVEHLEVTKETGDGSSARKAAAVEALQLLSEEMRSVVVMNIYQGLKYHEIAEVIEIPVGTVKTRMFYALRKLREVMGRENDRS